MTNSEIVSKIKRVLEDPEGVSEQELQDLASTFARNCRVVDAGLARANVCLQSGQLCETYRLLKEENFLEDSMTLMFSEFDDWQSICRALDLEAPIPISREASANLFVFELEYEKVSKEYARYRRLELERAPASKRLEAMYRIKEGLPNYVDVLRRPVRTLEAQFESEIRDVLMKMTPEVAVVTNIERIYANLTSPMREEPASIEMVQAAQSWREYVANVAALNRLNEFVAQWHTAVSDDEHLRYKAEFERQRSYFESAAAIAPEALKEDLGALLEQANFIEHNAIARGVYRQKVDKLRRALSRRATADELANLLEEAELSADAAGMPVPPELQTEVGGQIDAIRSLKRRKRAAIIAGIVLLIGFFAFLIVKTTASSQRAREASQAAAELKSALDAFAQIETKASNYDQLARARDIVERNGNAFDGCQEYELEVQRYERAESEENARQQRFQSAVEEIEDNHERGLSAYGMLANLKKLARTDAERTEYNRLYNLDKNLASQGSAQRNKKYDDELKALTSKFDELEADDETSLTDKAREFGRILERLESLAETETFGVSEAYVNNRKAFETKVQKTLATVRNNAALDETQAALRQSVGDVDAYRQALDDARAKFDDDKRSQAALDDAATDVANAPRADAWNQFVAAHGDPNDWAWNAEAYRSGADDLTSKKGALSFAPEFQKAQGYARDLKEFASRGGYEAAIAALQKAFDDYSRPLWVLHSEADEYYYVTSEPKDGAVKNLKYLLEPKGTPKDFNAVEFKSKRVPIEAVVAPQHALRKLIDAGLKSDYESYISTLGDAFKTLADGDEESLDPALHLVLVGKLAQSAEKFPPLDPIATWRSESAKKPDVKFEINFLRPGKELRLSRAAARTALDAAPPELSSVGKVARDYAAELRTGLKCEYRWVGFIDVVDNKPSVVFKDAAPKENGALWVAQGADAVATQCGKLTNGNAELTRGNDWTKARWTPVYLRVAVK